MTVQELIERLEKIEDKNQQVVLECTRDGYYCWPKVRNVDEEFFTEEVILSGESD